MKQFLHATATLIGMIVGAGIFAVPYVSAQAGVASGIFWIVLLTSVMLLVHLFFGEVVGGTQGKHRLAGYAHRYLGKHTKRVVLIAQTLGGWGAQLAYMVLSGVFLSVLFNGGEGGRVVYSLVVFLIVALVTFFGVRLFDRIEFWLTWGLLAVIAIIFLKGAPFVEAMNFTSLQPGQFFFPYGVILFALGGAIAIPEMADLVGRRMRVLRASIVAGTVVSGLVTLLFMLVVVGISGYATTEEAFEGLRGTLGDGIIRLGAVFGFFSVITSYLLIPLYLKETFMYDFRVKPLPAWFFAVGMPLLFFLAGAQNFVDILDIMGSIFGGFDGIMILVVALAFFKRRHVARRKLKTALGIIGITLLAVGVIQKLVQLL